MEGAQLENPISLCNETGTGEGKQLESELEGLQITSQNELMPHIGIDAKQSYQALEQGHIEANTLEEGGTIQPDGPNKEKRRNSLERYKPPSAGSLSKEEREKHRRRGHFGENKGQEDQQAEDLEKHNKVGRPHGRYRGRGVNKADNNSRRNQREPRDNNADETENPPEGGQQSNTRGKPFLYKSQLSKEWAAYSCEDDWDNGKEDEAAREYWEKDQSQGGRSSSTKHQRNQYQPSGGNRTENHNGQRPHQHDQNYKNSQYEHTDLRQKLNEKRAANSSWEDNSWGQNPIQQNGQNGRFKGENYQNGKHEQKPFGDASNDNANKAERWGNDRNRGNRAKDDSYGRGGGKGAAGNLPRPKKNTENFNPCYDPPEMRILAATPGVQCYTRPLGSRDVIIVVSKYIGYPV